MADVVRMVHVYLQTKSAVTDIAGTRGYPGNLAQDTAYPAYVLTQISSESEQHLGGLHGIGRTRIQVDCYAEATANDGGHELAYSLSEQIRLAMKATPPLTMDGISVDQVIDEGGFTRSEQPIDGSDIWRHRHSRDYTLLHTEATP